MENEEVKKEESLPEPIIFHLSNIQILSKSLESGEEYIGKPIDYHFQLSSETKVQATNFSVLIFVYINIMERESHKRIIHLDTVFFFQITDFEKHIILQENGTYFVPNDFENTIRMVSISTSRGILYSELRGTFYHQAILPVVFLDQLLPLPPVD